MTERSRTVTAVLLCMVVIGALAMIILALPGAATVPEPIEVSLDFDAFAAGVVQTRWSPVDVPVRSNVTEAGVVQSTGLASDIEWTFELCQRGACRPFASGTQVEPGAYTMQVSAMLDAAADVAGTGQVVGRILLVESPSPAPPRPTYLIWLATIGLVAVVLAAFGVRHLRGVPA